MYHYILLAGKLRKKPISNSFKTFCLPGKCKLDECITSAIHYIQFIVHRPCLDLERVYRH